MTRRMLCSFAVLPLSAETPPLTAPDLRLYETVLQKYVREDGRVDYAGLRKNSADLDEFVGQIAGVSPDSAPAIFPGKRERLAYWINAYNALVLKAFASEYPGKRNPLDRRVGTGGILLSDEA